MESFTATAIAATELADLNTFALVLAELPDGSGRRRELQRALTFEDQDRRLGQGTYIPAKEKGWAIIGSASYCTQEVAIRLHSALDGALLVGDETWFVSREACLRADASRAANVAARARGCGAKSKPS